MNFKSNRSILVMAFLTLVLVASTASAAGPIKIGILQGLSGPYEVYGKQEVTGFKMGLEYATKGTNKIIGRDVKLIIEDTQLKAARAKMLLTKLYSDDKVDLAIGPTSSGVALAILPVAKQLKKTSSLSLRWPIPSPVKPGTAISSVRSDAFALLDNDVNISICYSNPPHNLFPRKV